MLIRGGNKKRINNLNPIIKKTLLLMSFSCLSFGAAHSMDVQEKEPREPLRSSASVDSQHLQKELQIQLKEFDVQDQYAPLAFLKDHTTLKQQRDRLDRLVESFVPQTPGNPANVRTKPLTEFTDWRIRNLFLTEPFKFIIGKPNDSLKAEEESKRKLATKKREALQPKIEERRAKDAEDLKKWEERKQKEQGRSKKVSIKSQQPLSANQIRQQLSEKLSTWFLNVCEVPYDQCNDLDAKIDLLNQWLSTLSLQNKRRTTEYLLKKLDIDHKAPVILNAPEILNKLVGWLWEDINSHAQSLYEMLWPLYLESTISLSEVENTAPEAKREEEALKKILVNRQLFGKLQIDMADAITGPIENYLTETFKKIEKKHASLKTEIRASFREAMNQVTGRGTIPFLKSDPEMVMVFKDVIAKVLDEAVLMAVQQATGQNSDSHKNGDWSAKKVTYKLETDNITIHVTPIEQEIYNILTKKLKWMSYFSISYSTTESVDPAKIVRLPISREVRESWKVSESQDVKRTKIVELCTTDGEKIWKVSDFLKQDIQDEHVVPKSDQLKKWATVNPPEAPKSTDSKGWEDYINEAQLYDIDRRLPLKLYDLVQHNQRQDFLTEIQHVRDRSKPYDNEQKSPPNLKDTIKSKKRVFIMPELPKFLTHQKKMIMPLFAEVNTFFENYMKMISDNQNALQTGSVQKSYLNTSRTDIDLLNYPENKYRWVKWLCRNGVLAEDWELIGKLITTPPKFTNNKNEDVPGEYEFIREVKDLTRISLKLKDLASVFNVSESVLSDKNAKLTKAQEENFLKVIDHYNLNIPLLFHYADKLCWFMSIYDESYGNYEKGNFEKKLMSSSIAVKGSIEYVLDAHNNEVLIVDEYIKDWVRVIHYFNELFENQLLHTFNKFGDKMFDELKRIYEPTVSNYENDVQEISAEEKDSTSTSTPTTPLNRSFELKVNATDTSGSTNVSPSLVLSPQGVPLEDFVVISSSDSSKDHTQSETLPPEFGKASTTPNSNSPSSRSTTTRSKMKRANSTPDLNANNTTSPTTTLPILIPNRDPQPGVTIISRDIPFPKPKGTVQSRQRGPNASGVPLTNGDENQKTRS